MAIRVKDGSSMLEKLNSNLKVIGKKLRIVLR